MARQASGDAENPAVEALDAKVETGVKTADLPPSVPEPMRVLADDLPENDAVQEAHKEIISQEEPHKADQAKAKLVDESPRSYATPSGYAAQKVAGIANDTERGEEYAKHKSAVRWGSLPDDASGGEAEGV
jgi:hypothetical protein